MLESKLHAGGADAEAKHEVVSSSEHIPAKLSSLAKETATLGDGFCGTLQGSLAADSFNDLGAVAFMQRRTSYLDLNRTRSFAERNFSPLTAGGLRSSIITLVQTALGGGVLTLAYALRLSGLGLGLAIMVATGAVAFLGMDVMMRGAVKMQAFDTATLLAKCVGSWSGPAMDLLLVVYGNGAMIAYFILLGDFLPSVVIDLGILAPVAVGVPAAKTKLRTNCILGALLLVVPACIPKKLSALRYATPVALLAIVLTAVCVICKAPNHYAAQARQPIDWFVLDWNFFQTFSIFLFAYNCHLNVVPVASELQSPSDKRIAKLNRGVVAVELALYGLIATGGYLSFFAETHQNILTNYTNSPDIVACRFLLSCSILVGIPTNVNPTVRSLQGFVEACVPSLRQDRLPMSQKMRLLNCEDGSSASPQVLRSLFHTLSNFVNQTVNGDGLRYFLTVLCLFVEVAVAIVVPNVADVMAFLGASIGTILMMVVPIAVLLVALKDEFSPGRTAAIACYLIGATAISCTAIIVMALQKLSILPK